MNENYIGEEWKVPKWAKGGMHQKRLETTGLHHCQFAIYYCFQRSALHRGSEPVNFWKLRASNYHAFNGNQCKR